MLAKLDARDAGTQLRIARARVEDAEADLKIRETFPGQHLRTDMALLLFEPAGREGVASGPATAPAAVQPPPPANPATSR